MSPLGGHRWAIVLSAGVALVVGASLGAVALTARPGPDPAADAAAHGADAASSQAADGSALVVSARPSPTAAAPGSPKPPAGPGSGGCAFAVAEGVCPTAPPVAAATGKHWNIGFAAEFSGSTLDRTKLTPCFDWNSGDCTSTFNNGREHYLPSQVVVSNGTAKLIAAPLNPPYATSACQNGSCTYQAGLLSTARPKASAANYLYTFTYGYVESRFLFPATQGFFTAFWMLPADPSYDYQTEIDILELLGDDPTTMFMTYNYNGRRQSFPVNKGKFNNGSCPVQDYSRGFVRMGVDWEPDHIAWYINGVECARFTDAAAIGNQPMQLILHMMVDNDWQRRWNVGLLDPTLVRQLEVDYIRVYQQSA